MSEQALKRDHISARIAAKIKYKCLALLNLIYHIVHIALSEIELGHLPYEEILADFGIAVTIDAIFGFCIPDQVPDISTVIIRQSAGKELVLN